MVFIEVLKDMRAEFQSRRVIRFYFFQNTSVKFLKKINSFLNINKWQNNILYYEKLQKITFLYENKDLVVKKCCDAGNNMLQY